jgi:Rv0078B-related antitoxin
MASDLLVDRAPGVEAGRVERSSARLRTAFALHESGVALKRAQLRRQHASASEVELARRLAEWLQSRPGATHGDSAGVPGRRVGSLG